MITSPNTSSILHTAARKGPFNILGYSVHERTNTNICKTGHNFYAVQGHGFKVWEPKYAPVPPNFYPLNPAKSHTDQIPKHVDFDILLAETRFGQAQFSLQLARLLHLPVVVIEHTCPMTDWPRSYVLNLKQLKGNINVFITKWSRQEWGWNENEAEVVYHGVDQHVFSPDNTVEKQPHALVICNDFPNRDAPCGFSLYKEIAQGLPTKVVGHSPGFSEAAKSLEELVGFYRGAQVFLNTSLRSPIPTVMLEAAACGCAIVSTNNCAIPECFTHGHDAYLSNDAKELRMYCQMLMADQKERERIGKNARNTILARFSLDRFVGEWNKIFERASKIPYTGQY